MVYNYNKVESRNYDMRVTFSLAGHENSRTCLSIKCEKVANDNYFTFVSSNGYYQRKKNNDMIKNCQLLLQLVKL